MPRVDAELFRGGTRKTLTLVFEEGDDVLAGVQAAMKEHGIACGKVVSCAGLLKTGTMHGFEGSGFKCRDIKDVLLSNVAGKFVCCGEGEFSGRLNVSFCEGMRTRNGTLAKGVAGDGLTICLEFVEFNS